MEILKVYGVLVEIIDTVNMIYTNSTAQSLSPDGDTEFFEILAGVLREILSHHIYSLLLWITPWNKQLGAKAT